MVDEMRLSREPGPGRPPPAPLTTEDGELAGRANAMFFTSVGFIASVLAPSDELRTSTISPWRPNVLPNNPDAGRQTSREVQVESYAGNGVDIDSNLRHYARLRSTRLSHWLLLVRLGQLLEGVAGIQASREPNINTKT